MTLAEFRSLLAEARLVASVQTAPGSPLDEPDVLAKLAQCSLNEGVKILRLQGVENIRAIRAATGAPVIGLIKRDYEDSEIYITPTSREVAELIETGCEVIALDGTRRQRPGREGLKALIDQIHAAGRLAMADIDRIENAEYAVDCGADIVSSTLSGYTQSSAKALDQGPNLYLIQQMKRDLKRKVLILAEGRYETPDQVEQAIAAGAHGVVIGGAINDPLKMTRKFLAATQPPIQRVGAVDLGGTWLRFGEFERGNIDSDPFEKNVLAPIALRVERIPLPATHAERLQWISDQARDLETIGISAGGVIHPVSKKVIDAKGFIPDYLGQSFQVPDKKVVALNDGLAQAYGHACALPLEARTATLALGSGVGCGVATSRMIETNAQGDYPRLNDQICFDGKTFEEILGGLQLGSDPSEGDQEIAKRAATEAVKRIFDLWHPSRLVVCGGVGLSPWMASHWQELGKTHELTLSPYGPDAGLFGAAWLALRQPKVGG